jgi:hypothetical protein
MEQKGINTITNEIKNYLTDIVNTYLRQGVPSTIISLIVENIDYELKIVSEKVIKDEQKQFEEKKQKEINQENKTE